MRPLSRHALVDVVLSVVSLYGSFWIYELGNYTSLALSGSSASLTIMGVLPVGTVAFSTSNYWMPTLLAKAFQIALTAALMLLVARMARSMDLVLLEGAAICVLSIFVASAYWESLTLVSKLSLGAHELLFVAVSVALQVGLMRAMKYSPNRGLQASA